MDTETPAPYGPASIALAGTRSVDVDLSRIAPAAVGGSA
jgi:hypothetical protein